MAHIIKTIAIAPLIIAILGGCAGSPSMTLAESQSNPDYPQGPAQNVAVMMLYPDERFEDRALVENAFTAQWRDSGINAQPG